MKHILYLVISLFLIGCGPSGYNFETKAMYIAPKSNLTTYVTAIGQVLAGEDVGKGTATAKICGNSLSDTIYVLIENEKVTSLSYKKVKMAISEAKGVSVSLQNCFTVINYNNYNLDEIEELGKVIQASTAGPKGTYMEGQTKLIEVISVEFERN